MIKTGGANVALAELRTGSGYGPVKLSPMVACPILASASSWSPVSS